MKTDYHIHTSLCKHASGSMETYVEKAIEKGFDEIAFTDHIPLPDRIDIAHRMDEKELEGYVKAVERLQARYPEINILLGIEADFYEGFELYLQNVLQRFPFQIVILSVHFVKGWPDGNWVFRYHFPDRPLRAVYADYLQAVLKGVKSGLFNVVGHLDLVKRPEQPLLKENRTEIEEILKLAKAQQMVVEINTSGLRKEIGEPFPHSSIWPLLAKHNIPVVLGSDAHAPEQIGFMFSEIENQLSQVTTLQKAQMVNGHFKPVPFANQSQSQTLTVR